MRVFVLTAGRTGSLTFSLACRHATNFTSGHETNIGRVTRRFEYPDQHIEVDNRLAWLPALLAEANPDAYYVHLVRDPRAVARSYASRSMDRSHGRRRVIDSVKRHRGRTRVPLVDAFSHGIIRQQGILTQAQIEASADLMVSTINSNIAEFLRSRPHQVVDIAEAADRIGDVWQAVGAEGDLAAARNEFSMLHNAGPPA